MRIFEIPTPINNLFGVAFLCAKVPQRKEKDLDHFFDNVMVSKVQVHRFDFISAVQ